MRCVENSQSWRTLEGEEVVAVNGEDVATMTLGWHLVGGRIAVGPPTPSEVELIGAIIFSKVRNCYT